MIRPIMMRSIFATGLLVFTSHAFGVQPMTRSALGTGGDANLGVGATIGAPTGMSLFYELDRSNFVQAGGAVSVDGDYMVSGDFGSGYPGVFGWSQNLAPYWAIGAAAIRTDGEWIDRSVDQGETGTYLAARVPVGVNFRFPHNPVQLGGEVAPTMVLNPELDVYLFGGVHARIMF